MGDTQPTNAEISQGTIEAWKEFLHDLRDDFRTMTQSMNEMHERLSRVETNVQHIASKQDGAENFEVRITLLEDGQKNIREESKRRASDMRWFVGLVVTGGAVLVPILIYAAEHIHFN